MKLAVFGASGATGRALLAQAAKKGVAVKALVRDGDLSSEDLFGATLVYGKPTDGAAVEKTLAGCDAVVCVFGQRPPYKDIFCDKATQEIITAMLSKNITRLVVQTGGMIGKYSQNRSLLFNAVAKLIQQKNPDMMRDRNAQESQIINSTLSWTIVKPPRLTNDPATGKYAADTDVRLGLLSSIARADLADFLLTVATSNLHNREIVFVRKSRGLRTVAAEIPEREVSPEFAFGD